MIRVGIVEDEKNIYDNLLNCITRFFNENAIAFDVRYFEDANSLLKVYKNDFDLLFLDIQVPGVDGMEAARLLREKDEKVMIIFVTSLAQYALKGYEVMAFDFIVKPFTYYNLEMTLTRAAPRLINKSDEFSVVDNQRTTRKIVISDLLYVEVIDHKIYLHLKDEVINVYGTLKDFVTKLKDYNFSMCNRCYLVNLNYVSSINKEFVKVGDDNLLISRPRRKEFINDLNVYLSTGAKK